MRANTTPAPGTRLPASHTVASARRSHDAAPTRFAVADPGVESTPSSVWKKDPHRLSVLEDGPCRKTPKLTSLSHFEPQTPGMLSSHHSDTEPYFMTCDTPQDDVVHDELEYSTRSRAELSFRGDNHTEESSTVHSLATSMRLPGGPPPIELPEPQSSSHAAPEAMARSAAEVAAAPVTPTAALPPWSPHAAVAQLLASRAAEATQRLVELCAVPSALGNRTAAVQALVEQGADVCVQDSRLGAPPLHTFLLLGLVDCVVACLASPLPIDFTTVEPVTLSSPLHCALRCPDDSGRVRGALLRLLTDRILARGDPVHWEQKDQQGMDLANAACASGNLSGLWDAISSVPYFQEGRTTGRRIVLVARPNRFDWDQLGTDQWHFALVNGLLDDTLGLAMASMVPLPNPAAIESFVENGADLLFQVPGMPLPILHSFICRGLLECVAVCFHTSQPIDFTRQGRTRGGRMPFHRVSASPLHCVCLSSCASTALLELVVRRLKAHPSDKVDWSERDGQRLDFLSCAAAHRRLSLFWPVLKKLPYFQQLPKPVPLHCAVSHTDWNQLSRTDRLCFDPWKHGFTAGGQSHL